jgi:hypothetical protein
LLKEAVEQVSEHRCAVSFVYGLVERRLECVPVAGGLVFAAFDLAARPADLNWLAQMTMPRAF